MPASPEKPSLEYRVHLGPNGEPGPLRIIRQERREAGLKSRDFRGRLRGRKEEEIQYAAELMRERDLDDKERRGKAEFLSRFEAVIKLIEEREMQIQEKALLYATKTDFTKSSLDSEEALEKSQQILNQLSPIKTIANEPATFLSQPLPILNEAQWDEILLLTEAAQPFYTSKFDSNEHVWGALLEGSLAGDALSLAEVVNHWLDSKEFKPETIKTFFRALARIRNADCLYYGGMYFPGETDPNTFISNLALIYEKTSERLKTSTREKTNASVTEIAECLNEEAIMLRVIEAQGFSFTKHDRPVHHNDVLLPAISAIIAEMKRDMAENSYQPEEFAQKIIGAFRSRRCMLTDETLFSICSYFQGNVLPEEIESPVYHHRLPWMVLEMSNQQMPAPRRVASFRQAPTTKERRPVLCRALGQLNLEINLTAPLVPHLLLETRKMGYLQNIDYNYYEKLGIEKEVWNRHQEILHQEKAPLQINQGDIVVFVPLSGWCLTEAHLRIALASHQIGKTVIQCLEIDGQKPLSERETKVVFTFGMYGPKLAKGMPDVKTRSGLATLALAHHENTYTAQPGEIDERQERSGRMKELMKLYEKKFGITWSSSVNGDYPGQGCIALAAGATEKLGTQANGTRSYCYAPQEDKPGEDIEFLNSLGQIFALLKGDINPPSTMAELISKVAGNFKEEGVAILATHFPELHSTAAANMVKEFLEAEKVGEDKLADKKRRAFSTMVPPAIITPAWNMMEKRVANQYPQLERQRLLRRRKRKKE